MSAPPFARPRVRRKWEVGPGFASVHELVDWILAGGLTYWSDRYSRPLAPGWMQGQQLATLIRITPTARRAVERDQ